MTPDFDVIVVGSGMAGVSTASPLVEAGLRVLMLDGGKRPDIQPPEVDFLTARANDTDQWKWMVGENFHALKMRDAVSPKLRAPTQSYAFEGFDSWNKIEGDGFITIGSLATGGLSNAWGCGVSRYSDREMAAFPFPSSGLDFSYAKVSKRIGISGKSDDDMSGFFGLDEYSQPPIQMDALHTRLFQRYAHKRDRLISHGFRMGRSRTAALSEDISDRKACNLSCNCLWGCRRHSLYSAVEDLPGLRKHENFKELSGFVVDGLTRHDGNWRIEGQNVSDNGRKTITANKIVLAAGTLATTRIALKALNYNLSVPMLSCPTAAFLLWLPGLLGTPRSPAFGFGQLSFALELQGNISGFGSTFSTTGIPLSEFARHVPLRRRYGIDLLRALMSSCVVGNLFLPGHLTAAEVRLRDDDSLIVSGKYKDEVKPLLDEARSKLRRSYWSLGAILLPGSFTVGRLGGDIHYAGTLPMRKSPKAGETSHLGEVEGLKGVYITDGACLPVLPAKSHALTIMANADRIGRSIAQEHISQS
ncbi:MAG: GMC family oxidoreductase [Nitrospinae bacterium]|nr:GMC family oxidoreductase [Nitrospinota bacterium]MBF0633103.1 GMC family oxidoreductase [Nitrospinota bacterium]